MFGRAAEPLMLQQIVRITHDACRDIIIIIIIMILLIINIVVILIIIIVVIIITASAYDQHVDVRASTPTNYSLASGGLL